MAEQELEEPREEELQIDLGNLLAYDSRRLTSSLFDEHEKADSNVMQLGRMAMQALAKEMFHLPSTPDKVGRIVSLPPPKTSLPREKPLPKPRPPTKWEKFAQSKGIVKRKRSKLEWDEGAQEWRRRYGYKRVNDENEEVVIEAKPGDDPSVDPFTAKRAEKKARVSKQEKNRLQNLKEAAKKSGKAALPSTVQISATSIPIFGSKGPLVKPGKQEISKAASLAGAATASIGKFDKKRPDEKPLKNTGKRRKFLPVVEGGSTKGKERKMIEDIMNQVIAKNDHEIMDINKAVKVYERQEESKNKEANMSKSPKGNKGKKGFKQGPRSKSENKKGNKRR